MGPPVPRCFSAAITGPPLARRSQATPPPPPPPHHHQLLATAACLRLASLQAPGIHLPHCSRPAAACTVLPPPFASRPPVPSVPAVTRFSLSFLAKATQQRSWLGSALACFLAFLGLFDSRAAARFLGPLDWARRWNYACLVCSLMPNFSC